MRATNTGNGNLNIFSDFHLKRAAFNECRKIKVIAIANHKEVKQSSEPIKLEVIIARENVCERVTIGFGFTSNWMKKQWREFFKPIL